MSEVEGRVPIALARETSRRSFLKTAAWTGAALSAVGIAGFGVAVRRAEAEGEYKTYEGLGDAAIVQFAYIPELLEAILSVTQNWNPGAGVAPTTTIPSASGTIPGASGG